MTTQETAKITANQPLSEGYWKIRLTCGPDYREAVPGQFVTLRIPGKNEPLLRRPFSIHRLLAEDGKDLQMEILYRVVGGFTIQMSGLLKGGSIDMLGPLGHGFTVVRHDRPLALAAGGIGVAPLVFLAERLKQTGTDMRIARVFLGGKTKTDILCADIFSTLGAGVSIATEDGTAGRQGIVTGPLQDWLGENNPSMIYACGPHPMLAAIGKIARSRGISCEISIETFMACGLGVCMGCAVQTEDSGKGYRHVCKDGPVFDANRLI